MSFDNALAVAGGFGKFQMLVILLTLPGRSTLPLQYLLHNFIGLAPSHHCNSDSLDDGGVFRNLSQEEKLRVSIPLGQDGLPDSCVMFAEPQYQLLLQNSSNTIGLPTVPCQRGWVYDRSTSRNSLATEWDLVCDGKKLNRASSTVFFIGVMFGAALFGFLSDHFGRKNALLAGYLTAGTFGLISAFSNSFAMFMAMRFFTGMGLSGLSLITIGLIIEWVDISHRMATIILISLDWSVFVSLLSALAYLIPDWRALTAAVISPMLLAIICWWWIPESARWLIANGKAKTAHHYLKQCARVNGRDECVDDLKPEALSKAIVVENEDRKYSFLDLVRTPKMRRLALLSGFLWFSVACPYYGISFNVASLGINIYLSQLVYGVIEIPGKIFVFLTLDRIGRRPILSAASGVSSLCILCNMFIPKGIFQAVVASIGKMFAEAAFTVLYLYTAEIYPTVVRQNGLGYCSFMARIGVSGAPLIFLLEEVWGHFPSLIFFIVSVAASVLPLLLPETKNVRLPETIEDVEHTRRRSHLTSEEEAMSYSDLKTEASHNNE